LIRADDMKMLAPSLQHVTSLKFEHCTFSKGAVLELAACTRLQRVDLKMTLVDGIPDLAVLRDLKKSLSLSLSIEDVQGPRWQDPDLEFLTSLHSCLTSLTVKCTDRTQPLSIVVQHLHNLKELSVLDSYGPLTNDQAVALAGSPAGQHLRTLIQLERTEVDLASLAALMAMLQLKRLEGIRTRREDTEPHTTQAQLPPFHWPSGKPLMRLLMGTVHLDHLAVIPLQHCSSFSTGILWIAEQLSEEQRVQLMRTVHMNAAKCESFSCSRISPSPRHSGIGLAGVQPDGPLRPWGSWMQIENARITAGDTKVLAAMQAGMDNLAFHDCQLAADALPALRRDSSSHIHLKLKSCTWPSVTDLASYLLQFAKAWVTGSDKSAQLEIVAEDCSPLAVSCSKALNTAFRYDGRTRFLPYYTAE
jgi:hypothetical protein